MRCTNMPNIVCITQRQQALYCTHYLTWKIQSGGYRLFFLVGGSFHTQSDNLFQQRIKGASLFLQIKGELGRLHLNPPIFWNKLQKKVCKFKKMKNVQNRERTRLRNMIFFYLALFEPTLYIFLLSALQSNYLSL